jgi:hypothetical protein
MNICLTRIGFVWLCYLFSGGLVKAQAGFNAKFGLENWSFKDEMEMTGESSHPGQMIGFDVFVEDKRFLFVPGFHYHRISLENEDQSFSADFSEQHHAHYFMIPLTAGYKLTKDGIVNLSILGGGEVAFFYDVDDNDLGFDDSGFIGVSTNLTAMFHAELFSFLTTEVKYHYGLQPTLKNRDESKLRGWTLALGVKF